VSGGFGDTTLAGKRPSNLIVMKKTEERTIGRRKITVSNPDKVLYPAAHFTKAQVIEYYTRVAPFILPHLRGRPVTLKRFPNGASGDFFYEKDAPRFTPEWIRTASVPRRDRNRADIRYVVIDDLPTLVWLANLANLEIHPFLHKTPHLGRPTSVVFDFDPGQGADILDCARIAFNVRGLLAELGLKCFAKVSGSKGLQVYIPLNTAAGGISGNAGVCQSCRRTHAGTSPRSGRFEDG
jgi:bifunctional non-homologous end joining protein LigD